jgi:hypothetical protein
MSDIVEKQQKFSLMIAQLIVWLYEQGYTARQGDAWRSTDKLKVPTGQPGFDDDEEYSYQDLLFYNRKSKVTYSKHNDRLAQDFIIEKDNKAITDQDSRLIGEKWESMGGRWGGRFGVKQEEYATKIGWDAGHFELD